MTQNERQMVTGVVVNKKVNIDRDTFRELKSRLHICKKIGPSGLLGKVNSRNGKAINTTEDLRIHLRGKLNYFNNINPQKTGALIKTYNEVEW
jgi:isocitrate/isopropylmalate dehydrogenase